MKEEYKKRYKDELILSQKQLEQMSAHHIIDWFMENFELKDLSEINPNWVEQQRYKDFPLWDLEKLLKDKIVDNGRIKIRKAKKGFVLEMKFNWRSKGYKKTQYLCRRCKKEELLNFELICKRCTNHLKKKKQFNKFWWNNPPILKNG
ncbi:hypothetical protein CCP1ISM_60021 [Azospirillaceae bacterium]